MVVCCLSFANIAFRFHVLDTVFTTMGSTDFRSLGALQIFFVEPTPDPAVHVRRRRLRLLRLYFNLYITLVVNSLLIKSAKTFCGFGRCSTDGGLRRRPLSSTKKLVAFSSRLRFGTMSFIRDIASYFKKGSDPVPVSLHESLAATALPLVAGWFKVPFQYNEEETVQQNWNRFFLEYQGNEAEAERKAVIALLEEARDKFEFEPLQPPQTIRQFLVEFSRFVEVQTREKVATEQNMAANAAGVEGEVFAADNLGAGVAQLLAKARPIIISSYQCTCNL